MFNNGLSVVLIVALFAGSYLGAFYGKRKGAELVITPLATFFAAFFGWMGLSFFGGSLLAVVLDFPLTANPSTGGLTDLGSVVLVLAGLTSLGLVFLYYRRTRWMADVRSTAISLTSPNYEASPFMKTAQR